MTNTRQRQIPSGYPGTAVPGKHLVAVGAALVWAIGLAAPPLRAEPQASDALVPLPAPWTSVFRVDPAHPHHFVNAEGQHLFLLNKTAWAYFGCKDPLAVVERARSLGATVLRVALEGRPYYDTLQIDLWPWGGTRQSPDWNTFNEAYWQQVEERIRLAGERGIGFDLVFYFTLQPTAAEIEKQRPYWQKILRHLAKYPNVFCWEIANEYVANETFQDAAGNFFKTHDPFSRPVCTSTGTTDNAIWPQKPWVDIAVNHSCTSSTPAHDLEHWYLAVARNTRSHGKPAFCNESGREKRHRNDDPVHRRKQAWLWCAAGAYWTWHSWDGCEGINDSTYRAPGEEFIRPLADFFRSVPFWEMSPNYVRCLIEDRTLVHTTLATTDGRSLLTYVCTRESGKVVQGARATVRLAQGTYTVRFLRPADLHVLAEQRLAFQGLAKPFALSLPQFRDDLLILMQSAGKTVEGKMPGTD